MSGHSNHNQGHTIRLDKTALDALFPEGSQARVDLSAAVVNNFVERLGRIYVEEMLGKHVTTLRKEIETQATQFKGQIELVAENAVKYYFGAESTWDHMKRQLSPAARLRIVESINADFDETAKAAVEEMIDKERVQMIVMAKLSEIVGCDVSSVQHTITMMVETALKEKFK